MANEYQTVEAWKMWAADNTSYLSNAEGDSLDDVIGECLAAASRDIENDTGRVFYLIEQEARSTRVDDTGRVSFVDAVAGADIEVLVDMDGDDIPETEMPSSAYLLLPFTDKQGRVSTRYNALVARRGSGWSLAPGRMVQITTDWGCVVEDDLTPPSIVMACNLRAGRLFARREAKLGAISVPNLGTVGMVKGRDQDYLDAIRAYILSDEEPAYALS